MRERLNAVTIGVGAATLLALVLGLLELGSESLWIDEGASLRQTSGSWGHLWDVYLHEEPNIVFYYAVLKASSALIGTSEFALRLPSVLFAAPTVPVVAAIAARIYGPRAAVAAAVLSALSVFLLRYAQEARAYALVVLLASASVLLFLRAVDPGDHGWKRWLAWAAVSAAAVWAHTFAAFVIAAQAAALAVHPRRPPLRTLLGAVGVFAVLVAPLPIGIVSADLDAPDWIDPTTWDAVVDTFEELAGGELLAWLLLAAGTVGLLGAALAWRRGERRPEPWQVTLAVGWLVLPFVLAVLVSLRDPTFTARYLIVALPGLMLLAAGGLARLRPLPVAVAALIGLAALAAGRISDFYDAQRKEDWRSAARLVADEATPGDAVLVFTFNTTTFDYYYDDEPAAETTSVIHGQEAGEFEAYAGRPTWLVIHGIEGISGAYALIPQLVGVNHVPADAWDFNRIRVELWMPKTSSPGEAPPT